MARKKIREYDSKRLVKEHFKRIAGYELAIKSAQVLLLLYDLLYKLLLLVLVLVFVP